METAHTSLFRRPDTLFGVCQAIGEDFGFNPIYMRVTLAVLLLWNPTVVIGTYAAAAVIVLFSRLVFPKARRGKAAKRADAGAALPAPAAANETVELAVAA